MVQDSQVTCAFWEAAHSTGNVAIGAVGRVASIRSVSGDVLGGNAE